MCPRLSSFSFTKMRVNTRLLILFTVVQPRRKQNTVQVLGFGFWALGLGPQTIN